MYKARLPPFAEFMIAFGCIKELYEAIARSESVPNGGHS